MGFKGLFGWIVEQAVYAIIVVAAIKGLKHLKDQKIAQVFIIVFLATFIIVWLNNPHVFDALIQFIVGKATGGK